MLVTRVREKDIFAVDAIFRQARKYFRENGIPQWQAEYPGVADIRKDMAQGIGFVALKDDEAVGYCAISAGEDPTYQVIEHGEWLNDEPYVVIHRVCVRNDMKGKNVASYLVAQAARVARFHRMRNLRVDTHVLNTPMRRLLRKQGFEPCGIIYLADGAERLAHQKILDE